MIHVKVLPTGVDLLIAIQESWNHFDKGYCFKLTKFMPEKIKAIIKAQGGIKYFCQ